MRRSRFRLCAPSSSQNREVRSATHAHRVERVHFDHEQIAHRLLFDEVSKQLNITKQEDWYRVTRKTLERESPTTLLEHHYTNAIQYAYPEYHWHPWKFEFVPQMYWHEHEHHRYYLDWLAEQLDIELQHDWYRVTSEDIIQRGGSGLLHHFKNSLFQCLQSSYNEFQWLPWLFTTSPKLWNSKDVQKQYFDWLEGELGIQHKDEWYSYSGNDIRKMGHTSLLETFYGGSLLAALQNLYPQHTFYPWLFQQVPHDFWSKETNRRSYFDWLAVKLGVNTQEEWYRVTKDEVKKLKGGHMLDNLHNGMLYHALQTVYPEFSWYAWKFPQPLPTNFWIQPEHQKQYVEWLYSEALQLQSIDELSQISEAKIQELEGGKNFLLQHENSFIHALLSIVDVSEIPQSWFEAAPPTFWQNTENQEKYLKWFAAKHAIHQSEDWYKVTPQMLMDRGGNKLVEMYNGSLLKILNTHFSNVSWNSEKFQKVQSVEVQQNGVYTGVLNNSHRRYFDWLAAQLNLHTLDDWYGVTCQKVREKGGGLILQQYNNSLWIALKMNYPEHEFVPMMFKNIPRTLPPEEKFKFVKEKERLRVEKLRKMLDAMAIKFNIKKSHDWYGLTSNQLQQLLASKVLVHVNNSLSAALQQAYPEFEWIPWLVGPQHFAFWSKHENQRKLLDWIAEELDIETSNDWYEVSSNFLGEIGEEFQVSFLNSESSIAKVLKMVYPEYEWYPWLFYSCSPNFWDSMENRKEYFDWVADVLMIERYEDWFHVNTTHIKALEGGCLLKNVSTYHVGNLLKQIYPQYDWDMWNFPSVPKNFWSDKSNQSTVSNLMNSLMPEPHKKLLEIE